MHSKNWEAMVAARRDVYGEAAMRRPNGASYEFFRDLLPPLRYCNAAFRHYPIVLGLPGSQQKIRLVSNGSAVNAAAGLNTWRDTGVPVTFSVEGEVFGSDLKRLDGPRYAEGYLPIVTSSYRKDAVSYGQEVFAATGEPFASHGAAFVRFAVDQGKGGIVSARIGGDAEIRLDGRALVDGKGQALVWCGSEWTWDQASRTLEARVAPDRPAVLAVFTLPAPLETSRALSGGDYDRHRAAAAGMWRALLSRGTLIETPEDVVNNAWRSLVVGNFVLVRGNEMLYSALNQYERMFEQESGDAARALLLYGYGSDVRTMLPPLLDYQQQGLSFHDAAFKLQLLSHYYWITRDAQTVRANAARWKREAEHIVKGRTAETGLLPAENYCGDITTQVVTLNSNGNAWRGIRDLSAILKDLGEQQESKPLADTAREFREVIRKAVAQSQFQDTEPPFIPVALFGAEKPYGALTESTMASYYNLLIPLVLGSGVLGDESEQTGWILETLHQRGGVCMGMTRFDQHSGLFANAKGLDDLYGMRYTLALLRRDDVERALVSFYGKLAHGLTRDTFIGGEGSSLVPLDEFGRPSYLPPCSSGNGFFLQTLRYLLVQDYDTNDDGEPETLRLMFGTPRRWLEDGKRICIERAPTAFGDVSVELRSNLSGGLVTARVSAPARKPERMLLRARVPEGWRAVSAACAGRDLPVSPDGSVDITGMTGSFTVEFKTAQDTAR